MDKVNMFHTRCFSLTPYSTEQMFNLINDVSSYSKFIPGCSIINILKYNNNELIAEINLTRNGIIRSVITHNFFIKNKSIVIFLIEGPFKSFYGCWNFASINDVISSIEYFSYYEFKSILIEKIFNHVFQKVCKNITKIFIARACQIYGIP